MNSMKKLSFMLLFSIFSITAFAGKPIQVSELPADAQVLLNTHFTSIKVANVVKDFDDGSVEYEVRLVDGTEIDFNSKGVWQNISMPRGKAVPQSIIPKGVSDYLKSNGISSNVEELSRERRGFFEVELIDGTELRLKG